jgi:hypothetical protein
VREQFRRERIAAHAELMARREALPTEATDVCGAWPFQVLRLAEESVVYSAA